MGALLLVLEVFGVAHLSVAKILANHKAGYTEICRKIFVSVEKNSCSGHFGVAESFLQRKSMRNAGIIFHQKRFV